jgi:ANTAR domain
VTNSSDLVAVIAELHAVLAPGDLAQTLSRVTDAAVELLPDVDGATITVEGTDGRVETAAATGSVDAAAEPVRDDGAVAAELAADTAARLDRLQRVLDEGPAVDLTDSAGSAGAFDAPDLVGRPDAGGVNEPGQAPSVRTTDLSRDERYPTYGVVAARAGVRAQVSVVLFETARSRGVLNLYSAQSGAFDDTAVLTDLFAHHSGTALAYAVDYEDRETVVAERRAIGQALGIMMERYELSESAAFALLQRTAEHRAVRVRLVAEELVARTEEAGSQE